MIKKIFEKKQNTSIHQAFSLKTLPFFKFIQNWIITNKKIRRRPRTAFRIVNLFLLYSSDSGSNNYEDYYPVKIMLYHSFTNLNDLITSDEMKRLYEFIYYLC